MYAQLVWFLIDVFWPLVILNLIIILQASLAFAFLAVRVRSQRRHVYWNCMKNCPWAPHFTASVQSVCRISCLVQPIVSGFALTQCEARASCIRWKWISSHSCEWIHYLIVARQARISIHVVDLHLISIILFWGFAWWLGLVMMVISPASTLC